MVVLEAAEAVMGEVAAVDVAVEEEAVEADLLLMALTYLTSIETSPLMSGAVLDPQET